MKSTLSGKFAAVLTAFLIASVSSAAMADSQWGQHHPRREQVNTRLQNQHERIEHRVQAGTMSHFEAMRLHRADRRIRQHERVMASRHHGHLTLAQQHALDHREHVASRHIRY